MGHDCSGVPRDYDMPNFMGQGEFPAGGGGAGIDQDPGLGSGADTDCDPVYAEG
jgi:hypothetical protein